MSSYQNDLNKVHTKAKWTFWKFLPLFIAISVTLALLGFGLNSAGLFGRAVVERKVFEQSYQRQESIKSQIGTDKAVLAEIQVQLKNPSLDTTSRFNLEAQAASARIRIAAAKGKM